MTKFTGRESWDLTEITNESGSIGRPLQASELTVPAYVEIKDDSLIWWGASKGLQRTVSSDREMLDQFIKLVDARPEQIRSYARKWGLLHICEHGVPASHISESYSWKLGENIEECKPLGWPGIPEGFEVPDDKREMEKLFGGEEPIEKWREYSRDAQAVLNIAAMLHQGKRGKSEDWQKLTVGEHDLSKEDIDTQMELLTLIVKSWLLMGNVRPDITFHDGSKNKRKHELRPRITLGGCSPSWGHMFAALACQLMFAVIRGEGLAFCSSCSDAYIPKRRPRDDHEHYCERCGVKAAWRRASEKYRKQRVKKPRKS